MFRVNYVPIIRRNNCIYATLGTCYSVWIHTRQSSIQTNKYQVSHRYSCFSWWWTHSWPETCRERNKHTKKSFAPSWFYLQDFVMSVCLSTWNNSAPTGRIFMKFDIRIFFENLPRNLSFLKSDNNNRYFTWRPIYIYIFVIISRWIPLRMRNVSD